MRNEMADRIDLINQDIYCLLSLKTLKANITYKDYLKAIEDVFNQSFPNRSLTYIKIMINRAQNIVLSEDEFEELFGECD